MQKSTGILAAVACFLGGIIIGFLIAPAKQGIYCGNHSGNVYGGEPLPDEDCDGYDDEDDLPF